MGCGVSKDEPKSPPPDKFSLLAAQTAFGEDEVETLFELYRKISNAVVTDGYIHKEDLLFALFNKTDERSLFLDRMFDLFDVKKNGRIEFEEFVQTLSIFHPRTPQTEKIMYAFQMYDLRGTGYIEHEELKEMVRALLQESDLHLSNDIIESIVDKTFNEADLKGDRKIDMEEWEEYVAKNPSMLKNLTLPYLMDMNLTPQLCGEQRSTEITKENQMTSRGIDRNSSLIGPLDSKVQAAIRIVPGWCMYQYSCGSPY